MIRIKFECELLSDVIINQSAATDGNNSTLDFIPGNSFLGIVASHYTEYSKEDAMTLFHSGKVRFGDAHPESQMKPGFRTLRIPASLYYPKLKSQTDVCYVHHLYDRNKDKHNDGRPQQLKQCRNGFFAFTSGCGYPAVLDRSFALKSAYNRSLRRSQDEKMFGYESLDAGSIFLFDVEIDDDRLADVVRNNLVGRHHIGRSRTAQYGEVLIREKDYEEACSHLDKIKIGGSDYVAVYADGRLIFIDEDMELTLQPMARDLGVENGEIDWGLSQVRTFQYAPWNGKRATRDTDRLGIEKGSVFLVKLNGDSGPLQSRYVGAYQNEGFGKVVYNPDFLDEVDGKNGEAKVRLLEPEANLEGKVQLPLCGTPLLDYISRRQLAHEADIYIYEKVNDFVESNKKLFRSNGDKFPSQWGKIREIASRCKIGDDIRKELLGEGGYLRHGVAEGKWKKYGRVERLRNFMDDIESSRFGDILGKALVNLSSEMAKMK